MSGLYRVALALGLVWQAGTVRAQKLAISSYSLGSRIFEMEETGGSPLTIGRLLQAPGPYYDYLKGVQYNSLSGGIGSQRHHLYYVSLELAKPSSSARFWQKHTLQVGAFFSNKLTKAGLALANEQVQQQPDTTFILTRDQYSLTQQQRFLGIMTGVNRRFRLARQLQFLTGLQVQGSVATTHLYQPRWDSTTIVAAQQMASQTTKTSVLPELKGQHYAQWQALIPVGLEVAVYRQQLFVRAEANFGIVGSRFRPDWTSREAHGLGLWLTYRPAGR